MTEHKSRPATMLGIKHGQGVIAEGAAPGVFGLGASSSQQERACRPGGAGGVDSEGRDRAGRSDAVVDRGRETAGPPRSLAISRSDWVSLAVLSTVLSVLFWPHWTLVAGAGLDSGWIAGLIWAGDLGLRWGPDVIYTYGPLALLDFPQAAHRWQPVVASLAWVISVFGLVLMTYWLVHLRRELPRIQTFAVAAAACALLLTYTTNERFGPLLVSLIVIGSAVALVTRSYGVIVLMGIALGVIGHTKLSDAALALGVAVLCSIGSRTWRGIVVLGVSTSLTFVLLWIAAGQPIENLGTYLMLTLEAARGYPAAFGIEPAGSLWHYVVAIALVPPLLFQGWIAFAEFDRLTRVSWLITTIFALWFIAHDAFIRHDGGHAWYFFGIVVLLAVILLVVRPRRIHWEPGALALTVAFLVICTIYTPTPFLATIDRQGSLSSFGLTLRVITSETFAGQVTRDNNANLASQYQITDELRGELGTQETIVDPWDISALAATDAVWHPLPVLQAFMAYTPELDDINAENLISAPRQVLRSSPYGAIDGRFGYWESPRYQRVLYCGYGVVFETTVWQILRPSPGQRCGSPEPAGSSDAEAGEPIAVPRREGAITLATITPTTSALGWVADIALKPAETWVTYGSSTWRLAENPSAAELMLNGPLAHRAFASLPAIPFDTISVSRPATVDFQFVDVPAARLRIATAGAMPSGSTALALEPPAGDHSSDPGAVLAFNDVAVDQHGSCLLLRPMGADPQVVFSAPEGTMFYVQSGADGEAQVFLAERQFTEEASVRFHVIAGSIRTITIPSAGDSLPLQRLDPPASGTTLLCAARP